MKEIRTILTDEQFKKMKKMMPMKTDEKKPAKKTMKKQRAGDTSPVERAEKGPGNETRAFPFFGARFACFAVHNEEMKPRKP